MEYSYIFRVCIYINKEENKLKKNCLITLQGSKNYGSVLQAYSTQEYLKLLDFEVVVLNYYRPDQLSSNILNTFTRNSSYGVKIIKKIVLFPNIRLWKKTFTEFNQSHLHLTSKIFSLGTDFEEGIPDADFYCVGSDQVWNSTWNQGFIPELYLNFVSDEKKKISLSSSFGKTELGNLEGEKVSSLLNRFNSISVREKTALKMLEDLEVSGMDIAHTLDPTLMFTKEYWYNFANKRKNSKDYILIYQLNPNAKFDSYAKKYAKDNKLTLIRICTRFDKIFKNGKSVLLPEIQEFISLIIHAKVIITDSFHGTAFAINCNIPFISIYPPNFPTRIENLLEKTNFLSRRLSSYDQQIEFKNIDFTYSNEVLNSERNHTKDFILKSFVINDE